MYHNNGSSLSVNTNVMYAIKLIQYPRPTGIADYIAEQGTSGIWTYRKWNSGIAECWGTHTETLTLSTVSSTGLYGAGSSYVNYPSGLFIEEPNTNFSGRVGTGYCLTGTLYQASKDSMKCWVTSQVSGSQSCVFFIRAIGKWK